MRKSQVAVLVPVLGRPHRVGPVMESIAAATPEPHSVLFIADEGDDEELAALATAGAEVLEMDSGSSWATKINAGFHRTAEPWIFTGADDLSFHPDWFSRALRWAEPGTGVIGTNDLLNGRVMCGEHSTHSLVRRSYVEEQGTIDEADKVLHEGYAHEYADDELVQTAMSRGAYVHAFDSIVEHLHMLNGKAEDDETYRLGRSRTQYSRRHFQQRRRLWRRPGRDRDRAVRGRRPASRATSAGR